jgi:predicted TIM-barrel fold metal-dependent hydrolase
MQKTPAQSEAKRTVSELPKITVHSDTRDILAHAANDRETDDYFIVDVDAHVMETAFWSEITDRMDNDVYKQMAKAFKDRGGSPPGLLNATPGMLYQDVFGRIPHQQRLAEAVPGGRTHAQVTLVQRAMDSMGIDYMVVFPTPMLVLGMHPQAEVEVAIGNAFNRWLVEEILPQEPRIQAMLYLPFNHPEACLEVVERYADTPGVIGFTVTSTRFRPVHHDAYMPLYAAMEASGKPFAFHSGFHWGDQSMQQCNRFLSMHAISFVHFNLVHLTNWIVNGLPERFPKLKVIWIESGLAWVPFLMQRLDSEYMMRSSEAPLLRRKPSEYMAEMYYTSQPLERSNLKLTQATFEAINADTQLLFASDWPHWDFDLPSSITTLPFLSAEAKRNILGLNAARLFNLEVPAHKLAKPRRAPAERVPVPA